MVRKGKVIFGGSRFFLKVILRVFDSEMLEEVVIVFVFLGKYF